MTTIVLADDRTIIRQDLRALLEAEEDFSVVGESADGLEVTALVERLRPDVLVLDLLMPGINGIEVSWQVRQRAPDTNVIILSILANEPYVIAALRGGADGYVPVDASAVDSLQAVRNAIHGRRYLSPSLSRVYLETYIEKARSKSVDVLDLLTAREQEVFNLAAAGHTRREIGALLSISPRTAEAHRANLMRKLDLRAQAELIRYALHRENISVGN